MPEDQPSSGQATDSLAAAEWLQLNRANWDERTPIHVGSRFYRVDEFKSGVQTLHGFELDELPDLAGKDLVHLQCHFGLDTLSLARKGARVTGLDFSGPAVEAARELASAMGIDARFIEANVYDARAALGQAYDVVYTGKGAINWLPDIVTWAEIIADLLRPGGVFYLSEFHPVHSMLADDAPTVAYPYFNEGPMVWDSGEDYTDPEARLESSRTIEWAHPLSEVVTAVIEAGLRLEFLHEFAECSFKRFPWLVEVQPRVWTTPPGMPAVPMMYSLRAVKET
ncbi:MAG: class I SAM-dependent methyltransferase [Acidimicrobiales bacterium]